MPSECEPTLPLPDDPRRVKYKGHSMITTQRGVAIATGRPVNLMVYSNVTAVMRAASIPLEIESE